MPIIRTVRGDIPPAELGICYAHEHLLGQPPAQFAEADLILNDEAAALAELKLFAATGGRALVEMTTPDYGRNPAGLRRLADASGVHIIATTGYNKEKFSASFIQGNSTDELAERFVREICAGMDDTAICAGVIKAASTLNELSPVAERLFQAAARAHRRTGAPVSTHTEAGTMALEQVALLTGEGVSPAHIIIGHVDRKLDWPYQLRLAQTGVFLGYDQIAKEKYDPDNLRAEFIARLVNEGFGRQILLAGDMARRSSWRAFGAANPGYDYILTRFVPLLKTRGLSQAAVDDLLVHNPARALAFTPLL